MFEKIRKNISRLIDSSRNSMSLPQQFLRYGSRKTMYPDWSEVMMNDRDHYTGYSYGAITKRARIVARVASDFINTETPDDGDQDFIHPYIPLIKESKLFSENQFWLTISTYLDLEGWFPLMVLRNPDAARNPARNGQVGAPLMFKLLNPYNLTRVINQKDMTVGGYRETRNGLQRDIRKEMIIEIRELNPFNDTEPFAMTDAARESSYTLKSSGDYTRHTLRNNVDAPGIITTDVVLPEEKFKNFVARIKDHTKGEPIFGNGAGAVKWQQMTTDLSKSALKDINEVNRETLFAVTGMSKTMMGIEQSGTTRETSNVQKEMFIENEAVPRINLILDHLNLDYKNRYSEDYSKNKAILALLNPIESDQDIEAKKIMNKTKSYELYDSLVADGYDRDLAAKYANGEIGVEELEEPTNEPRVDPMEQPFQEQRVKQKNQASATLISDQESKLQNALVNIEGQLAVAAINRVPVHIKNQIDEESDLITKTDKKEAVNELILVLTAFYAIVAQMQGQETIEERIEKYGGSGKYVLDKIAKSGIRKTADAVAKSHVDTVSKELYEIAKKAALEGKSQREIIGIIKERYAHDITEHRARRVARTETNRAFTMAQYDADRQFIADNNLEERAFKRYHTRSSNPCAFCLKLERQGLIPFDEPFVKKGGTVTAKVDGENVTFKADFDNVFAGNLHPNCSCDYELIIEKE